MKLFANFDREAAAAAFEAALEADPTRTDSRNALGLVLLSLGEFTKAGPYYDARHDLPALNLPRPPLPFPEWRGEDLAGKRLLIWPEQGFGDQIQCARFVKLLHERGALVTMIVPPPLHRLFENRLPATVHAAEGRSDVQRPDYWVMATSVVTRLGLDWRSLPSEPYLSANPCISGGIGIMTSSNAAFAHGAAKSIPKPLTERLLQLPGAVSLEPSETGARDFADTAQIIAGLDLVISVDTAVAHLAGAMGKPVWVLLPKVGAGWPWVTGEASTPWYPTAKLVRNVEGWDAVVDEVARAVSALG